MTEHRALVPAHAADTTPATTIFTPRRRAKFCDQLAHHGNVRLAARAAGVSPQTAYRARRSCPDFAACWDAALVLARDVAEQVLADRAINGVEEAVYYHGEEVATRRRYDSRLLLAHLARLDARVEKDGAEALAGEFDDALVKLEAGEPVPRPAPASADSREPCGEGPCAEEEAEEEVPLVEAALRWLEAQRAKRGLDEDSFDDDPWGVEPQDDELADGEDEDYAEETAGENSPP